MALKLKWTPRVLGDVQRVYRSQTPFAADALPAMLAEIPANANEFTDETAPAGDVYYRVSVRDGAREAVSRSLHFFGETGAEPPIIPPTYTWVAGQEGPNLNYHQGVGFDGSHYYLIDSNRLGKFDLAWSQVASNTNPLGDIGITGKLIDGYVQDGKLWFVRNNKVEAFNTSDLTYSPADSVALSTPFSFSAVSGGPDPDLIYGIRYLVSETKISIFNRITGAVQPDITLSQGITSAQGITYHLGKFYISANANKVYEVELDGTVNGIVGTFTPGSTIEGMAVKGNQLLVNFDGGIEGLFKLFPVVTNDPNPPAGTFDFPLENTDAETGDTTGWIAVGGFGATTGPSGAIPSPRDGSYLFWGGVASYSYGVQDVAIPYEAWASVDAGTATLDYSWFFAGDPASSGAKDESRVILRFYDDKMANIGLIAPPLDSSPTAWTERTEAGQAVPAGTRVVRVEIQFKRNAGSQNNAYIDGVSATLNW